MQKPLVIIVSGAPGSGKTTMAKRLADYLMLPHIERDRITRGMEYTRGGERVDRVTEGLPMFFKHVESMLEDGISLVTDGTLYAGISESDYKNHIIPRAFAVNVHTRAKNEKQRFIDREMNREGQSSDWVQDHLKVLDRIYTQTVDPIDLGIPVIEVDATDGYYPNVDEIIKQITTLRDGASKKSDL